MKVLRQQSKKSWLVKALLWCGVTYTCLVVILLFLVVASLLSLSFADDGGLLYKYFLGLVYRIALPVYTGLDYIDWFLNIRTPLVMVLCNCALWLGMVVTAYYTIVNVLPVRGRWIIAYVIGLWLLTVPFIAFVGIFTFVDELP